MKHYSPTGRRNHGRPLKRPLDTWDRNGSTSGQLHDRYMMMMMMMMMIKWKNIGFILKFRRFLITIFRILLTNGAWEICGVKRGSWVFSKNCGLSRLNAPGNHQELVGSANFVSLTKKKSI
jgi:hypothetical protein